MSVTAYPTLRLKLTVPQALKVRFLPAIPGTNAGNAAAAAQAAAAQAIAAAAAATAATASKVDKAGDTMTGFLTLSADPVANLQAATKQYVDASASGSTGSVSTSGPVLTTQLAGYADATGNVIRGVNVGVGLDMSAGTTLNLDGDLSAIAALTGINTIYYRSSEAVWSPVTIGTNLSFAGGTLSAVAAGDVASVPTPTNGEFARWTDATHIEGISAATALTAIGAQSLDADLTALAALSGTNTIYYRSAANTWSPVLIGANMTFTGGTLSSSGGGGAGGVAAVGTPTAGQLARWTTTTTIEGIDTSTLGLAPLASPTFTGDARSVTPATGDNDTSIATTAYVQANLALYAPLASPVLTGDPQAPTPATADSDTSIATTAFVKAQAYAPLASPALTGNPTAPTATAGDNDTSIATTAFVTAAVAALPSGSASPPQGRLTLQTLTPVMTTTQSAKTTIFYTPYVGNKLPIYDGASMVMTTFAELSNITTNSAVGNAGPAAVGAGGVYDLFVWSNGGTPTLTRGPVWSTDTARSVGTVLVMVNGIWLNNASITNGPAAQRGTYVGTVRSNTSSQIDWIIGGAAVGGVQGVLNVWNHYNRVLATAFSNDSRASWTYNSTTWRFLDASSLNSVSFVRGLNEDAVMVNLHLTASGGATGDYVVGILLDGGSILAAIYGSFGSSSAPFELDYMGLISAGYHNIAAAERQVTTASTATAYGTVSTDQVQGFSVVARM